LKELDEATFLEVFDGVPQAEIARTKLTGVDIVAVLNEKQVLNLMERQEEPLLLIQFQLTKKKVRRILYFLPKI
jgi:hypothetical protein